MARMFCLLFVLAFGTHSAFGQELQTPESQELAGVNAKLAEMISYKGPLHAIKDEIRSSRSSGYSTSTISTDIDMMEFHLGQISSSLSWICMVFTVSVICRGLWAMMGMPVKKEEETEAATTEATAKPSTSP